MFSFVSRKCARQVLRNATSSYITVRSLYGDSTVQRVLAIETSCDDTSVAIADITHVPYEPPPWLWRPLLGQPIMAPPLTHVCVRFHEKVTANNDAYAGIHPLVALHSHQTNLATLIERAFLHVDPREADSPPELDLIAVTRGPGMRSNLSVGLDTAKGLATALRKPLVGVHHMQAHACTPQLVHAMNNAEFPYTEPGLEPSFPFLTALVSGGHTLLLDSRNAIEHKVLADTQDIAIGACIDKAARAILPPAELKAPYGRALERFAFGENVSDYSSLYKAPKRRADELERRKTKWNWSLGPPLAESNSAEKSSRRMVYSFAGLLSAVERYMKYECSPGGTVNLDRPRSADQISVEERKDLAREFIRVAFEHLASRILLHLSSVHPTHSDPQMRKVPGTIVVSGGVASNQYLRHVLRAILDIRGFKNIKLNFPPIELCTDNALMIAWAGWMMHASDWHSKLDIGPLRKWSMDPNAEDGGVLGVGGWKGRGIEKGGKPCPIWSTRDDYG